MYITYMLIGQVIHYVYLDINIENVCTNRPQGKDAQFKS